MISSPLISQIGFLIIDTHAAAIAAAAGSVVEPTPTPTPTPEPVGWTIQTGTDVDWTEQ